jgi:hypothetical protein
MLLIQGQAVKNSNFFGQILEQFSSVDFIPPSKPFFSEQLYHATPIHTTKKGLYEFQTLNPSKLHKKIKIQKPCLAVLRIRIQIHMFLGLLDPDPDPSIIVQQ